MGVEGVASQQDEDKTPGFPDLGLSVLICGHRGSLRLGNPLGFPIQRAVVSRAGLPLDLAFDGIAADRALVLRVRPLIRISRLEHIIHVTHCVIVSCERNVASVELRVLRGAIARL